MTGAGGELHLPGDDGRELHGDVQRGAHRRRTRRSATRAVLTVTAERRHTLTVTKSATPAVLVVGASGQSYTITIAVANGPDDGGDQRQ